ncbi:Cleavage and polyadenylation specificity factor subunit 1 [Boothiomyces sp. JEL0866]|nr:Cleavage and polyadenylation specificity factor subunit 1 [Boothiomyces sp. JEL0866]
MLYSLHKDLLPPSGIDFAVYSNFTGSPNLITAQSNILSIYKIKIPRLELIHQFTLNGVITSMQKVKNNLLLTFKDAKMSLLEWNETLVTISLHHYEKEEFRKDLMNKGAPKVVVDPLSRCAVLSFYQSQFAILPFVDDEKYPFSPSFVINSTDIEPSVKNIIDFVFLYGFLEPTIAILYETNQTFVGRLAHKKDTVSLIVVSLDLYQKTWPVLYKVDGLPYNCTHMEAVPNPLGGIIIFSHNALIHLDQTHQPGLACLVNPFFDLESNFKPIPNPEGPTIPVKNKPPSAYIKYSKFSDCKELGISLDGCRSVFLNPDVMLLVLRNGEFYRCDLIGDDGAGRGWNRKRSGIKTIQIKNLGIAAANPSCIVPLMDLNSIKKQVFGGNMTVDSIVYYFNYFFIASRVSDGQLIEYREPLYSTNAADDMETEEDIDLDLYGNSQKKTVKLDLPFLFKLCDLILVTGPLKSSALGLPARYSSYEFDRDTANLELVCCGGHDLQGKMVVLQNSIRPNIRTSFKLGKPDDVWTMKLGEYHDFIILSTVKETVVLKAGQEIEKLETGEFFTKGPTVAISAIGNRIVQVHPNGVLLLDQNAKKISELDIGDEDTWLVACHINIKYLVGLLTTGEIFKTPITCASVFVDNAKFKVFLKNNQLPIPKQEVEQKIEKDDEKMQVDKEEDLLEDDLDLYGEQEVNLPIIEDTVKIEEEEEVERPDTFWLFTVDENGTLKVYSLPAMEECFEYKGLHVAPSVISDKYTHSTTDYKKVLLQIEEISIVHLGCDADSSHPFLITRNDKMDVKIYKIVRNHPDLENGERLGIKFQRLDNNFISRDLQAYSDTEGDKMQPIAVKQKPKFLKKMHIVPFSNIGSSAKLYDGICILGNRPFCVLVSKVGGRLLPNFVTQPEGEKYVLEPEQVGSTNCLRIFPFSADGPITSFAPLHNVNVPFGFIYTTEKHQIRLAQLQSQFDYDFPWGICTNPLGRGAQKVAYHTTSETYAVATAVQAPFEIDKARYMAAVAAGVIEDGDELPDSEKKVSGIQDVISDRPPGMYMPRIFKFQLDLVSPITWEIIDTIHLRETEQILSMATVELASTENTSGRKTFIAVGTGYMRSEDLVNRGRLLVYEVIDVVPDPNNPQTNHKLKLFYSSDEKNTVAAVCAVNGYLLAAIGTKVIMYAMESGSLNGVAFLDVCIFVVSMSAVKNFIQISDVYKSVWFVVFQEDPAKLVLLGKDLYQTHVFSSEFVIGDSDLAIIVSDEEKNLHILTYEPISINDLSQRGERLLRRGESNIGVEVQSMNRIKHHPKKINNKYVASTNMAVVATTLAGSIVLITPIPEKMFKRLYGLYSRMVTHLEHYAGLNPRGYRQLKLPIRSIYSNPILTGPPGPRGILDGDMLYRYLNLSVTNQREMAKAVGSRDDRVIDDLLELMREFAPPPRIGHAQASVGNSIYIFGGRQGIQMNEKPLNDMFKFDTTVGEWSEIQAQNPPPARSYHRMVSSGTDLYVFAGCGPAGRLNDLYKYDTLQSTWTKLPASNDIVPRGGPCLAANNQKVVVCCGFSGYENDDIHIYDIKSQEWKLAPFKVPTARSVCPSTTLGDKLIIFGGEVAPSDLGHQGAGNFECDIQIVDLESGKVYKGENTGDVTPPPRGWTSMTAIDSNTTILYGGLNGDDSNPVHLDDTWELKFE